MTMTKMINPEIHREARMLALVILTMTTIVLALTKCGRDVAPAFAYANAQDLQVKSKDVAAISAATPVAIGRNKSYPLPDALSRTIAKLVDQRNLAERVLLNYISDPKIYESEDETVRAAMFDRQAKLFKQFATALQRTNEWVLAQRKEFNCPTCEVTRDKDGKWLFAEPETTAAAAVQGGTK